MTKTKLGLAALLVLLAAPAHAISTTYFYTGGAFDKIDISDNPSVGGGLFPNPYFADRATDVASFGTRITGSITFGFDTAGVTGSICFSFDGVCASGPTSLPGTGASSVVAASFLAGDHRISPFTGSSSFVTFSNGVITDWEIRGLTNCPPSLASLHRCVWSLTDRDLMYGLGTSYNPAYWSGPSGVWHVVQAVPGPVIGAGLPGLMLAGGLLAWWRRRRAPSS